MLGGIGTKKLLVTCGGKMKAEYVIHLNVEELDKNDNWDEGIQMCLQEAENRQLATVSFPALGTGWYECLYDIKM